ncbi:MAG: sulfite exporter TauE/SafE family protein, partial [Verrucomicrobiia bacterium]
MLAAFGAGFVNAVAGGGTLLTFPALLFAGLSSIAANATSTVAITPGSVMSSWAYRRHLAEKRTRVWTLALPSLLGGVGGAVLLFHTPEKTFRFVVPYLILLA